MSRENAISACICSVYSFSEAIRDKELWLLFLGALLEWGCTSYYTGCNTGREETKELAGVSYSSLREGVTLDCLQGQPIFIISEERSYV